jgi:hypothetical protein
LRRDDVLFVREPVFAADLVFVLVFALAVLVFVLVFARDLDALFAAVFFLALLLRVAPLFVLDFDALLVFDLDALLAAVFDFDALFRFAVLLRFAVLFRFAVLLRFEDAVVVLRRVVPDLRAPVERALVPLSLSLSPSLSSSWSPPPSSFFATTAAAGTARPIAVPATTFCGVERPSFSSWSSSLAMVDSPRHFDSLNASMNFGTIRSRTISGP